MPSMRLTHFLCTVHLYLDLATAWLHSRGTSVQRERRILNQQSSQVGYQHFLAPDMPSQAAICAEDPCLPPRPDL